MKAYHLTILRDGKYETIIGEMTSIENFILIERELGRDTHVLYSRELTNYDWILHKRREENKGNY